MIKRGLGRGLEALLPNTNINENEIRELRINQIEPSIDQPRKYFEEEALKSLSESIKNHGVVQPIIVTKENERLKIIAGERRWRAARLAGLKTIPAIIKELAGRKAFEIALIENLQRQDLNAIEEAEAFQRLAEDYKLKQEDIAVSVGKSRPAIANALRLLTLDQRVKEMVAVGRITGGHARTLVIIDNKDEQYQMAKELENKKLSVREAEEYIKKWSNSKQIKKVKTNKLRLIGNDISEKLKGILGTKVQLMAKKNKGKIVIDYYNNEELDRILELLYALAHPKS